MYELLNLYDNKLGIETKISYGNESLLLSLSSLVTKRSKEDLDPKYQYTLLNSYLDYKGDKFKKKLFNTFKNGETTLLSTLTNASIKPIPYSIVHDILDMFDLDDVVKYIRDVYKLPPPNLADEFDYQKERDGRATRVQTYLKSDYFELVSLALVLKAILPMIAHFGYIKAGGISKDNAEDILFSFIETHTKTMNYSAMDKLHGFIRKLIELAGSDGAYEAIRTIENKKSKDTYSMYLLAVVVFQKLVITPIIKDTTDRHITTQIYNYTNNKLKNNGDVSSSIRSKQPMSDMDGSAGDKESIIESYKISSELSAGDIVEINWSADEIDKIVSQLPVTLNKKNTDKVYLDSRLIKEAYVFTEKLLSVKIATVQTSILAIIFKDQIDPRSIKQLRIDKIRNLMAVGFAYLWTLNHKHIALLLTAYVDMDVDDAMHLNLSTSRQRLSKELKDELDVYFPYKKFINANTSENQVEVFINNTSNSILINQWILTADEKFVDELFPGDEIDIIPSDLKTKLGDMIIDLEKKRYLNN